MITINRQELYRGLKLASGIAATKSTLPILSSVLLRTVGSTGLSICATDLTIGISAHLRSMNLSAASAAFKAKDIAELVANAPGDEISIAIDERYHAEIKSGKVKYKLAGQSDRDYPKIQSAEDAQWSTIESVLLQEMIARTIFACSEDEGRVQLSGICVSSDATSLYMTATDGHRMCRVSRLAAPLTATPIIVPRRGCDAIVKLSQQGPLCKIARLGNYLFVQQDDTTIGVKLIEANFPDIQPVIEMARGYRLTCDRLTLMQAMKRSSLMTSEEIPIKMTLSPSLVTVTTVNPDMGEVVETIDAEYAGKPLSIGFNPHYVVEMISTMTSDMVIFEIDNPLSPVLVMPGAGDSYHGIIMPMRVS